MHDPPRCASTWGKGHLSDSRRGASSASEEPRLGALGAHGRTLVSRNISSHCHLAARLDGSGFEGLSCFLHSFTRIWLSRDSSVTASIVRAQQQTMADCICQSWLQRSHVFTLHALPKAGPVMPSAEGGVCFSASSSPISALTNSVWWQ